MHLRKLILVGGFASALLSNMASALGLGEVHLNSALNEPLDAEIKLLDTRGLSAGQVVVGLASPADFERNGVERLYFFTEFQFDVQLNHPGGAVVTVTSHNPVREPFLNFLVEARWPTGRLLREYTLLLDLPTFAEPSDVRGAALTAPTQAQAPQQPRTPTAAPQPSAPSTSAAPSQAPRASRAPSGDTYTVGSRDTLWQIALDVRPDSGHSVHQTMLAIQRLNPDAFINGNINLLRQGQVLRIPTSDEIQRLSRSEAVNEVARQNNAWADNSGLGAQLSGSRRDSRASGESQAVSGNVRLATPSSDTASNGQGSGDNAGRGRALESELASTLEELDKSRSENLELSARVRDLEDQIQTMERLVEVSNEQLRTLQLSIQESAASPRDDISVGDVSDTPYTEDARDTSPVAETPSAPDAWAPVPETTPQEQPVAEESAAPTPPPAPAPSVVPPRPAKTLVDHIMDNLKWVGLALAGLLVALGVFLHRRRQKALEEEFAAHEEDVFEMSPEEEEEAAAALADDLPEADDPVFESPDEDALHTEAETGDVVGEADIYIAYGKLDQAEEMLLNALEKDPGSIDIRMKLLEVYSQSRDLPKFDFHYAALLGVAGQASLARAAELRSQIPDAGEFNADEAEPAFAGIDIAETEDAIDLETTDLDLDGLDDLDLGSLDLDESPAEALVAAGDEDDLSFDFDLDGDEDTLPLADEQSLTDDSELRSGSSSYDLSFTNDIPFKATEGSIPPAELAAVADDDLSFDFSLDDQPAASQPETTPSAQSALDDDLGALDFTLDDEPAAQPVIEEPVIEELVSADDFTLAPATPPTIDTPVEDLAFDDAEGDIGLYDLESDVPAIVEELQLPDDGADDFNLDMDMDDLDIAALDREMESLETDLDDLDASLEFGAENLQTDSLAALDDSTSTLDDDLLSLDEPVAVSEDLASASDDDVFDAALSDITADGVDGDLGVLDDIGESDEDLDFLADADEAATKLDLARAYIDMGDADGARDILGEVVNEGNEAQRQEATDLLARIDT